MTTGPLANDAGLVSAANANHVQIWPTVDGGLDKTVIQALIHNSSKRAAHVQNLVNLATNNGYSGLDLDYEHLWDASDRADFSQLASEFGAAMHAVGLKASMAITAINAANGAYDYNALVGSLDMIHIMGYDRHGVGGTHIGPGDPIGWIKAVEDYALSTGFPMQFILGVPNFGFTLNDSCLGTGRSLCALVIFGGGCGRAPLGTFGTPVAQCAATAAGSSFANETVVASAATSANAGSPDMSAMSSTAITSRNVAFASPATSTPGRQSRFASGRSSAASQSVVVQKQRVVSSIPSQMPRATTSIETTPPLHPRLVGGSRRRLHSSPCASW